MTMSIQEIIDDAGAGGTDLPRWRELDQLIPKVMTAETRDKWIAALRAGDYRQTESVLHNGDGFCCLGVLAHINLGDRDLFTDIEDFAEEELCEQLLPKNSWGLDHSTQMALASINDAGYNFEDIALVIAITFADIENPLDVEGVHKTLLADGRIEYPRISN